MTGMRFIGPGPRAVALRSAANRLRWEVDVALGITLGGPSTAPVRPWEAGSVLLLHDLAETAAILRRVLDAIDDNAATAGLDPGWARERFRADLGRLFTYHEVGR